MPIEPNNIPTRKQRLLAWGVHAYTASGGVLGMVALLAVAEGRVRDAFFYLIAAMLIDVTDGTLARRAGVRAVLPNFSGSDLDNAIDVLTYIYVPIFILGSQGLLPHPLWTIVPMIAALYAYGQADMKTEDHYFLGFPSYWNVVALYVYWLEPAPAAAILTVSIPAVLTFIPTRYLYPSRNSDYWKTSWTFGGLWFALVFYLLLQETPSPGLVWLSLSYPAYYMLMSFYVDRRVRKARRHPEPLLP
jgi:phosphatidylcholine synthase